ncbi:MAG: hypothetical protein V8T45_04005 [Oscillospiraceae bacterium]
MKEYQYRISAKCKDTGDNIRLYVWAENADAATHKLCGILFGYHCEYEWCGTSPMYEGNKIISRDI